MELFPPSSSAVLGTAPLVPVSQNYIHAGVSEWKIPASKQGCNLWRNRVKLLPFSEQLIQPYLEGMRRTGTGLLEVQDFLRVKLDDLWLPVQKSSTSVRQRSDAAGTLSGPRRAAKRMEVTRINYVTSYNPASKR